MLPNEGVSFGNVVAGNICEDDLTLVGLTSETLVVQVLVICLNQEYEELDEYVFSVRKTNVYDYNDKLVVALQGKQPLGMKVALKVPNSREPAFVKGTIVIQVHGLDFGKVQGNITLPLIACIEVPLVVCPKMLQSSMYIFKLY